MMNFAKQARDEINRVVSKMDAEGYPAASINHALREAYERRTNKNPANRPDRTIPIKGEVG